MVCFFYLFSVNRPWTMIYMCINSYTHTKINLYILWRPHALTWYSYCCACFTINCESPCLPQGSARIFLLLPNVFTASGKILRPATTLFWKALVSLQVTFTRLSVLDETLRKIQSSPSQGTVKLKEEERPVLHHSKPYNYLLQDDRKEIAKALLTLTVMEKRRAKKS